MGGLPKWQLHSGDGIPGMYPGVWALVTHQLPNPWCLALFLCHPVVTFCQSRAGGAGGKAPGAFHDSTFPTNSALKCLNHSPATVGTQVLHSQICLGAVAPGRMWDRVEKQGSGSADGCGYFYSACELELFTFPFQMVPCSAHGTSPREADPAEHRALVGRWE